MQIKIKEILIQMEVYLCVVAEGMLAEGMQAQNLNTLMMFGVHRFSLTPPTPLPHVRNNMIKHDKNKSQRKEEKKGTSETKFCFCFRFAETTAFPGYGLWVLYHPLL